MAVTEQRPRPVVLPLLGHLGLVLAIIADFYRRSSDGGWSMLLSAVSLVALLVAGILFVRHPRSFFFFGSNGSASLGGRPNPITRLLAWVLVVATPVLWLIVIDRLSSVIPSGLAMRFVAAYVFFAWIAAAIIASPYLFGHRHE